MLSGFLDGSLQVLSFEISPCFKNQKCMSRSPESNENLANFSEGSVGFKHHHDTFRGHVVYIYLQMDISENSGTPKSSILIGFSIINHLFWGTTIFGNTHIYLQMNFLKLVVKVSLRVAEHG